MNLRNRFVRQHIVKDKFVRVILDNDFITEYLRCQNNKSIAVENVALVSEKDSVENEAVGRSDAVQSEADIRENNTSENEAVGGSDAVENESVTENDSAVLVETSDDEQDKSVVFISEEKPPEITPRSENGNLRKENQNLKNRLRNVEIHVAALQKRVRNQIAGETIEIDDEKYEEDKNSAPPIEIDSENVLPIDLDGTWLTNQIQQIEDDGNMTALAADIAQFMECDRE